MASNTFRRIIFIFIAAFVMNVIWENLHSVLYESYKGGEISQFILLRATLSDAVYIVFITLPFILRSKLKKYDWLIVVLGVIISIIIEFYALSTDRWVYKDLMPLIPFLNIGLTPVVQLGLLGYATFKLENMVFKPQ
ncbi:MAG: hypothetical protein WAV15_01080 [Minisyncoccia bacterium]